MLKRWFTLLLVALLPILGMAQNGTVYPIDLSVMMTPPYGTCLKEYVGSDRIVIQALLKDMSKTSEQFVIQLRVTDNRNRVVFQSWFGDYEFNPGETFTFPMGPNASPAQKSNVLQDLFNPDHASVRLRNECFDEGAYTFTFQAFERASYPVRKIALSMPFTYPVFLQGNTAQPLQIYPYDNDVICNHAYEYVLDAENNVKKFATQLNGIAYQWQSANPTGMRIGYHLQVVDLGDIEERTKGQIESAAQSAFRNGSFCPVNEIVYTPFYNHNITAGGYNENHAYAWRVRTVTGEELDKAPSYTKENMPSITDNNSPVRVFYFCGAPGIEKDTFKLLIDDRKFNKDLDKVEMDTVKTTGQSANAFWKDSDLKEKYCGVNVEIRKKGQEKWTPFFVEKSDETDAEGKAVDNSHNFENLSYNTRYEVRAQYVDCSGSSCQNRPEGCLYAPYSDVLEFMIPSPIDTAVCGDDLPKLTVCGEGTSVPKILSGDTIIANGAKVVVDEVSYPNASDSSIVSGKGHLSMPIVKNIQLKMEFSEIQINCAKELVKGKVKSIWDEQTCAMINLDELTGQGSTGGKDNAPSEASTEEYSEEKAKNSPSGTLLVDEQGNVKFKTKDGKVEDIGKSITLSSNEYQSKNYLAENSHYIEFYSTDKVNNAFDNDSAGWYRKMSHYDFFDAPNNKVILPWLANNPGKLKNIKAREVKKKETMASFDSVMFVIPSDAGFIQLKAEKEIVSRGGKNDTVYDLNIPGWADVNHSTPIFAIAKKSDTSSFFDAGKMMVANYAERTHKLNIVSLVGELDNSYKTEAEKALNSIYGKLGVTYEVNLSVFEDETIKDLLSDGLSIGADAESRWKVETREMDEIRSIYQMKNEIDNKSAYLFVVNHPQELEYEKSVKGDMPRNQSVGFIFSNNVNMNEVGRLIAHEIGHGVYKFQHTFDYGELAAFKEKTDNLMDYNSSDPVFLAQYQWRVMQDSVMFVWKGLQDDEDGFAGGVTPIPCWALGLGSYAASELIDEGISALSSDDYKFAEQFRQAIKDPISWSSAAYFGGKALDLGSTLYDKCVNEIGNIPSDIISLLSGLSKSYAKCSSKTTDAEKNNCWCEESSDLMVDMVYGIVKQIITYKKKDAKELSKEEKMTLANKLLKKMDFDKVGEVVKDLFVEADEKAVLAVVKEPLKEAICRSKVITEILTPKTNFYIEPNVVNDEYGIFNIYVKYENGASGLSSCNLFKDVLGDKISINLNNCTLTESPLSNDEMEPYKLYLVEMKEDDVVVTKKFSFSKTFNITKGGNDNFQYDYTSTAGSYVNKFKVKVPCDKKMYSLEAFAQLKKNEEKERAVKSLICPEEPKPGPKPKKLIQHDDCYEDDVKEKYLTGEKMFNVVYSRNKTFDSKRSANDFRRSVERQYDVPKCSGWESENGRFSYASPKICGESGRAVRLYKVESNGTAILQQEVAKDYYFKTFEFWGENFDSKLEKRIIVYIDGEYKMMPIEEYVDHYVLSDSGVDFMLKMYTSMTFRAFARIGKERVVTDIAKCKTHFRKSMSEVVEYIDKKSYSVEGNHFELNYLCYDSNSPLKDIIEDIKSCLLTRDEYVKNFNECAGLEGLLRKFSVKMESKHGYLRITKKQYEVAVLGMNRVYDEMDKVSEVPCIKQYDSELKSYGVMDLMPYSYYVKGNLYYRFEDGLGKWTYHFSGSNCTSYDDQMNQYLGLIFDFDELDNLYSIYLSRMQQYATGFSNALGGMNAKLVSGFNLRVNQTGKKLPHWWE